MGVRRLETVKPGAGAVKQSLNRHRRHGRDLPPSNGG